MKQICKKIAGVFRTIFGWGILITLFAGGATFFGYLAALTIGGETAAWICEVIYKKIIPVMIYVTTGTVLLGLVTMYLSGEVALTASTGKKK